MEDENANLLILMHIFIKFQPLLVVTELSGSSNRYECVFLIGFDANKILAEVLVHLSDSDFGYGIGLPEHFQTNAWIARSNRPRSLPL
jgi:hypothetical protein